MDREETIHIGCVHLCRVVIVSRTWEESHGTIHGCQITIFGGMCKGKTLHSGLLFKNLYFDNLVMISTISSCRLYIYEETPRNNVPF